MTKKCNSEQLGFNSILSCLLPWLFFFLVTFIYLSDVVCYVSISIEIYCVSVCVSWNHPEFSVANFSSEFHG